MAYRVDQTFKLHQVESIVHLEDRDEIDDLKLVFSDMDNMPGYPSQPMCSLLSFQPTVRKLIPDGLGPTRVVSLSFSC